MAWRVIDQLRDGRTQEAVAKTFEVSQGVISKYWIRLMETGSVPRRQKQVGQHQGYQKTIETYLNLLNASELRRKFSAVTGRLKLYANLVFHD